MAVDNTLASDSILAHVEVNGEGSITDEARASGKEIDEFEHKRNMQENEDKKEDQIRAMAWFALWGMLLYPVTIIATSLLGQETAAQLVSDIAPTYFVAIAGLVAAFFGANAYTKSKNSDKGAEK